MVNPIPLKKLCFLRKAFVEKSLRKAFQSPGLLTQWIHEYVSCHCDMTETMLKTLKRHSITQQGIRISTWNILNKVCEYQLGTYSTRYANINLEHTQGMRILTWNILNKVCGY